MIEVDVILERRIRVSTIAAYQTQARSYVDGKTLVWNNGYVETGFHRLRLDINTASTIIDIANCTFLSEGEVNNTADRGYTTSEDSRAVFECTGTGSGASANLTGCVFDNWASFALLLNINFDQCTITDSGAIDLGTGATFTNCTVSGYTGAADTGNLDWDVNLDPDGDLDNLTITKGTNAPRQGFVVHGPQIPIYHQVTQMAHPAERTISARGGCGGIGVYRSGSFVYGIGDG